MRMGEDFGDMTERGVKEVEIYKHILGERIYVEPERRNEERERERRKTGRAEARSGPTENNLIFFILCSSISSFFISIHEFHLFHLHLPPAR